LYISGQYIYAYNHEISLPNSTVEITFPSAGKHWEGLKNIRIYYKGSQLSVTEQVFDINSIDKPTKGKFGYYTINRERSLTDEADKLIVTTSNQNSDIIMN